MKKIMKSIALTAAITSTTAAYAYASSTGMPWDNTGDKIIAALSSKYMLAVCACAIVGIGFALAFGEGGGITQKILKVALGITVVIGAVSIVMNFFGASGCLF